MHSTASSFDIDDDDDSVCTVVQVEPPPNTAEAIVNISTLHSTEETSFFYYKNLAQKPHDDHRRLSAGRTVESTASATVSKTGGTESIDTAFVSQVIVLDFCCDGWFLSRNATRSTCSMF